MAKKFITHNHIAYLEVDQYIISWNRFYPSLLKFKKEDFDQILKLINDKTLEKEFDEDFLTLLRKNHFLTDENYLEKFNSESHSFIEACQKEMINFSENEQPFYSIQIFNEECNLNCPYCIIKYTWGKIPHHEKSRIRDLDEIYHRVARIIEKQYEIMKKHKKEDFVFSINGGEFLIHYGLLKRIISYIRETKDDKKSRIALNTNGVLINDDIANFLVQNDVDVFISIDGNKTHHDTTRVYHNGKGTYNDIINAIHLLKKHNFQRGSLSNIQGTIDNFSKIDLDELFTMSEYGFENARLSTNLMGIDPVEGEKRAVQFFEIVKKSSGEKIKIHDGIFDNYRNVVDKGINLKFTPFCNGLGGRASAALMYNISDNSLSYLCQYVSSAFLHVDDDIVKYMHSSELREKALNSIKRRNESILTNCKDCGIIGVCRGGCIMEGLTSQNEINEAACNYQQTLWFLYVKDIFEQKNTQQKTMDGVAPDTSKFVQ